MKTNLTIVNFKIVNKSTASNHQIELSFAKMIFGWSFSNAVQRSRHYLHLSKNAEKETRYIPGDTDIWITKS